jgi:hypothetical protein
VYFSLVTNLELGPSTIRPFGVLSHAVHIPKGLDALLDLASVVEDTTAAIHVVLDWLCFVVIGCVTLDSLVPVGEVRIIGDEGFQSIPLVGGCNDAGTVLANFGRGGTGKGLGVCWPSSLGIFGGNECRSNEELGVGL